MNIQDAMLIIGALGIVGMPFLLWRTASKPSSRFRTIIFGWICTIAWSLVFGVMLPTLIAYYIKPTHPELFPYGYFSGGMLCYIVAVPAGWIIPTVIAFVAPRSVHTHDAEPGQMENR
jgi:hypothetical protein